MLGVTFGFSDSGARAIVASGDENTGAACASFGVSNVGVADGAARDRSIYLLPFELIPGSNIRSSTHSPFGILEPASSPFYLCLPSPLSSKRPQVRAQRFSNLPSCHY